jgi:ribose/xylose/arabinose/galactoside ABC-type transport system permease subunit
MINNNKLSTKQTFFPRFLEGVKLIQWPLIALGVILLFNFFFTPGFFELEISDGRLTGSLMDLLKRAAPRLIIALGMTLVIATGGIDISVGSIAAIAGALAVLTIRGGDITYLATQGTSTVPMIFIIVVAIFAAALCGLFNGILVSIVRIQPIVATLILMVAGRGMAMLFTGGYVLNYDHPTYEALGVGDWFGLPVPIYLAIGTFVLIWLVTTRTPLGLLIQSTGGNETASRYSGTNTTVVRIIVYVIIGICSGLAGIIFTADVQSADSAFIGLWIELEAILAVVIGGTSMLGGRYSLAGTVVGALIIQTLITTLLTRAVPVQYTLIFQASVVVIVLILQSPKVKEMAFKRQARKEARSNA